MIRNLTLALLSAAIAAPLTAQIPCFNSTLGTSLELGDDDTGQGLSLGFTFTYAGVPYTQICVCSNGYVWLGATSVTGGDPTPSEAELSAGAPRAPQRRWPNIFAIRGGTSCCWPSKTTYRPPSDSSSR